MLKRIAAAVVVIALVAAVVLWFLSAPQPLAAEDLPNHTADRANGERVFYASGCASCHSAPEAEGEARLILQGGQEIRTEFGTFRVPNISTDPETGIGSWSTLEFVNAVTRGVSPEGAHYYPAFPYATYARMRLEDAMDLKAFMDTLPAASNEVAGHDLSFPYNVRRGLGLWKRLYLDQEPIVALADQNEQVQRGQYLVEALGHCGECHTPRTRLGGMIREQWLAGAPNPEGRGNIPNITPSDDGIGSWSASDIAESLESGLTPDFDSFGGRMREVQENMAMLPDEDRQAMAAYLKAIPPLPDAVTRDE